MLSRQSLSHGSEFELHTEVEWEPQKPEYPGTHLVKEPQYRRGILARLLGTKETHYVAIVFMEEEVQSSSFITAQRDASYGEAETSGGGGLTFRDSWPLCTRHRQPIAYSAAPFASFTSTHTPLIYIKLKDNKVSMPGEACVQIKEELVACVIRSDWYVDPTPFP